jgi:hypothetical protein
MQSLHDMEGFETIDTQHNKGKPHPELLCHQRIANLIYPEFYASTAQLTYIQARAQVSGLVTCAF